MKTRLLAVPLLLVGSAALGHVVLVARGVHFKTDPIDFGQPPRRRALDFDDGTGYEGVDGAWRPGTKYRRDYFDFEEADGVYEAREKRLAALKKSLPRAAAAAELAGRYEEALRIYARLEGMQEVGQAFVGARRELFATPGLAGTRGLRAYLRATNPLTRGPLPTDVGPLLQPWVAYARAATPADYARVAREAPASSRAAAALIMAARLWVDHEKPRPTLADMALARRAADALLRESPKSRFAWDAQGVLARIDFLKGRLGPAMRRYEAQARSADTPARTTRAYGSLIACVRPGGRRDALAYAYLRWAEAMEGSDPYVARSFLYRTLGRFSGPDAVAFYGRLAKDPRSLAYYLDFRAGLEPTAPDVLALAANARRAAAGTPYRAEIDATLARVALAAGDGRVRQYALDAQRGTGDAEALGTFVLATLDRRAGRLAEARAGYASILKNHPKSYLAGGVRENLALVSERLGDLAGALDGYRALGYWQDVAYLADVRMTPAELAAYVARNPREKALRYTLAMRHLRKGEWDAAERALRPLSTADRRQLASGKDWSYSREWDGDLQDPLVTVRALRKLDQEVQGAQGAEAKAAALSAMGDYYYRHKCLLLYSGPVWRGARDYTIAFSWNPTVATPKDDAALRAHYDEHECYTQAVARYRRVVEEFPTSKVASHAAYWAGVATERLSNMSPYWRWRDQREDLKARSIALMALAARSPDPALAKKARKYAGVFATERDESRKAFADEKPPSRRWNADN